MFCRIIVKEDIILVSTCPTYYL